MPPVVVTPTTARPIMTATDDRAVTDKNTDGTTTHDESSTDHSVDTPAATIETTAYPEEVSAAVRVTDGVIVLSIRSESIGGTLFFGVDDAAQLQAELSDALNDLN